VLGRVSWNRQSCCAAVGQIAASSGRILRRAVRDHLFGADAGVLEPQEKRGDDVTIHGPIHQLLPNHTIARGCRWIDGQQQG
jgi:hypothetical protein